MSTTKSKIEDSSIASANALADAYAEIVRGKSLGARLIAVSMITQSEFLSLSDAMPEKKDELQKKLRTGFEEAIR